MAETNQELKKWLTKHKIENYGYDWRYFQKMSQHKAKLNAKIKNMSDAEVRRNLAKAGILGKGRRLSKTRTRKGNKVWDYTTGQSFNEELINMLQIGSGNKKSFWETQEGWY